MSITTPDSEFPPQPQAVAVTLPRPPRDTLSAALGIVPGLLLTGGIAAAAFGLRALPGLSLLSPMILSIFIGIAFHNVIRTPPVA